MVEALVRLLISAVQSTTWLTHMPDGSIMAFPMETQFDASIGLDEIVEEQRPIALRHNVSFGDL